MQMNPSTAPLISIVTINRNNADNLYRTLSNTSTQQEADYEQIVVDGASTDGSVDVVRDPALRVDRWISEPDSGVYEAQNKGLRLARGRFVLFMNSGDHFLNNQSLAMATARLDEADLQSFDIVVRGYQRLHGGQDFVKCAPDTPTFSYFARDTLPHQSTFIRRDLFERYGEYDTSLKIVADWKAFLLWICRHNCSYRHHPLPLSVFYGDGLSSRPENEEIHRAERRQVLEQEFAAFLADVDELTEGRRALKQIDTLRGSRVVRALQGVGLLWKF